MTTSAQMYGYVRASSLGANGLLDLQTSGGVTTAGPAAHPRFFSGFLGEAEPAAAALLAVANVAQARYWRPNLAALRDPVVTCNGDRLRFESFSGCCGVYARLDVLDEGMDGVALDRGTTNVDVNNPLRLALARVRGGDPLKLEVGPEGLEATTFDGTVVERKVPLPPRWLRGFAEVQAVTSGYDLRVSLTAADAARFLRSLPSAPRGVQWVVPAGRSLRLAAQPGPGRCAWPAPRGCGSCCRCCASAARSIYTGPTSLGGPGRWPASGSWTSPGCGWCSRSRRRSSAGSRGRARC